MSRDNAKRLEINDESRNRAALHKEPWLSNDIEFLMAFWPDTHGNVDEEREVAECLGRTIEACRQYFYEERAGKHTPSPHVHRRSTTTTTTTTVTEYIGHCDDPEDQWWSPATPNGK
jgi:hypothetical protein